MVKGQVVRHVSPAHRDLFTYLWSCHLAHVHAFSMVGKPLWRLQKMVVSCFQFPAHRVSSQNGCAGTELYRVLCLLSHSVVAEESSVPIACLLRTNGPRDRRPTGVVVAYGPRPFPLPWSMCIHVYVPTYLCMLRNPRLPGKLPGFCRACQRQLHHVHAHRLGGQAFGCGPVSVDWRRLVRWLQPTSLPDKLVGPASTAT